MIIPLIMGASQQKPSGGDDWTLDFNDLNLELSGFWWWNQLAVGQTEQLEIPENVQLYFEFIGPYSTAEFSLQINGFEVFLQVSSGTYELNVNQGDLLSFYYQANYFGGDVTGTVIIKENDNNGRLIGTLNVYSDFGNQGTGG